MRGNSWGWHENTLSTYDKGDFIYNFHEHDEGNDNLDLIKITTYIYNIIYQ